MRRIHRWPVFRCISQASMLRTTGPLWGESIGDRWIPIRKDQQCGKLYCVITLSWFVLPVRPFEPHFACVLDDGIILHPDPRNCSVYWSCVSLTTTQILRAIRHVCPRGQWFDRDLQRCNDIREVRNCALEAIHVPLIPNTDHAIPSEAPADAAPSYRG